MSEYAGASIYHGVWVNWSHGRVLGSTLTLSSRNGNLLTAFLAVFVAAAGTAAWRIISFTLHQMRASAQPQDGIHHQQQIVFKNTGSPETAAWQFLRIFYAWRKIARRSFWRSVPLAMLALATLAAFGTAGVFSSEVTKAAGSDVLVRSGNCGNWTGTGFSSDGLLRKALNDTIVASTYSRACYNVQSSALQCNQYAKQQLPYAVIQNTTCPFADGMCIYGNTAAFAMDTGNMSSHDDLGINTRETDRITYRRRTTCAPLQDEGYVTWFNFSDVPDDIGTTWQGQEGDVIDFFNFGPTRGDIYNQPEGKNNYTFFYNQHAATTGYGYELSSYEYSPYLNNSWDADSAVYRDDADITIMFLSANGLLYQGTVDDPVFSAHYEIYSTNTFTFYSSDFFVNPLACIDQHVFCNPNNGKCTDLQSYEYAVHDATRNLGLNAVQSMIVGTMGPNLVLQTMDANINGRGPAALRAQELVAGLVSEPIPNNQWQIEVESWFTTGLAKLQQSTVEFAVGTTNIMDTGATNIVRPTDNVGKMLCNNQKVASDGSTMNFSVLGIVLILTFGFVLIITNTCADTIVSHLQKKKDPDHHKRLQWIMDDKFQLQRLAYEEAGLGVWNGCCSAVPTTLPGQTFGLPPDVDAEHPCLTSAPVITGTSFASQSGGKVEGGKSYNPIYVEFSGRGSTDEEGMQGGREMSDFSSSVHEEFSRIR